MTLEKLMENMEEIAGMWNGKESGVLEDNAMIALEVIEHIKAIKELTDNFK